MLPNARRSSSFACAASLASGPTGVDGLSSKGRSIAVTRIKTEPTEYGDIQRYRVDVSGFDAPTWIAILRADSAVDARVLAAVVDSELLLGYKGSEESGLLRDPALRAARRAS